MKTDHAQIQHDKSALVPYVTKYYDEHYQYYRMNEHSHEEYELMYVKDGQCRVSYIDPASGTDTFSLLKERQYIGIKRGIRHNLFIDRDHPCHILNVEIGFRPDPCPVRLNLLAEESGFMTLRNKAPAIVLLWDDGSVFAALTALHELLRETDTRSTDSEPFCTTGVALASLLLFSRIADQYILRSERASSSGQYVRQAKKHIERSYDTAEGVNIPELAKSIAVSPAHLQRLFKAETGMTLISYANLLRVRKAKQLLKTTDLSIIDVAINIGVGSRQRLNQLFTEYEGMSPGEYRKLWRNREFEQ